MHKFRPKLNIKGIVILYIVFGCQTSISTNLVKSEVDIANEEVSSSPTEKSMPNVSNFIDEKYKDIVVQTVAGTGEKGFKEGPLIEAQFTNVIDSCLDPSTKEIFLIDSNNIRKITADNLH